MGVSEMLTLPRVGTLTSFEQQSLTLLGMQASHAELVSEAPSLWNRACAVASQLVGQTIDRDDPRQRVCVGRQELNPGHEFPVEVGGLWFLFSAHSDRPERPQDVTAVPVPVYQFSVESFVTPLNDFELADAMVIRFLLAQLRVARSRGLLPDLTDNFAQLARPLG